MADPLSIAASIAGLLSLGIQVTQNLIDFYNAYKHRDEDIARIVRRLDQQLEVLSSLKLVIGQRSPLDQEEQQILKQIITYVQDCDAVIHDLDEASRKIQRTPNQDLKTALKQAGRRAAYPFRRSTLESFDENIETIIHNLNLTLSLLQLKDTQTLNDEAREQKQLLQTVRASQLSRDLHEWLNAPDATLNHNAALSQRHPETGRWFIDGHEFHKWLDADNSLLWLSGFAGCGKTVLCSTIVQSVFQRVKFSPGVGIAFFYFTFTENSKQDHMEMLKALLLQLCGQSESAQQDLQRLRDAHKTGSCSAAELLSTAKSIFKRFQNTYVYLDALDESPRGKTRDLVLDTISTMRQWNLPGLHLLVTSRDEVDIRDMLEPSPGEEIPMKNSGIDEDIASFVRQKLRSDRQLVRKWQPHFDKIERVMVARAQGVFRWVECQFDALRRCPRSENDLDVCLRSLPQSLDETYERMLCLIDNHTKIKARRLLTLLCFARRPPTVAEAIDAIAVDLCEPAHLDVRSRLQDADDLKEICPGLIVISHAKTATRTGHGSTQEDDPNTSLLVRIAHYSVQEYLESERIREGKASFFALDFHSGHTEIAEICLTCLSIPDAYFSQTSTFDPLTFPSFIGSQEGSRLVSYAEHHWFSHITEAGRPSELCQQQMRRLFRLKPTTKFHNQATTVNHDGFEVEQYLTEEFLAKSFEYAADLGCLWLAEQLVSRVLRDPEIGEASTARLLQRALGDALHYAWNEMIGLLLNCGTDVNDSSRPISMLQSAVRKLDTEIVTMFLDYGSEVNMVVRERLPKGFHQFCAKCSRLYLLGNIDPNALSSDEESELLNILQAPDAEELTMEIPDDRFGLNYNFSTALQDASFFGNIETVQILLDRGTDPNLSESPHTKPFTLALWRGDWDVAKVLFDAGARILPEDASTPIPERLSNSASHEVVEEMPFDA